MRFLISLILLMCAGSLSAQKIEDYYRAMPDSLCPLLTTNNRLDLCDFMAAGMEAKVRNRLDGISTATKLTDDYLHVKLSSASEAEYQLVVNEIDTLIRVTHTAIVNDSIRHSIVKWYDTKWNEAKQHP